MGPVREGAAVSNMRHITLLEGAQVDEGAAELVEPFADGLRRHRRQAERLELTFGLRHRQHRGIAPPRHLHQLRV